MPYTRVSGTEIPRDSRKTNTATNLNPQDEHKNRQGIRGSENSERERQRSRSRVDRGRTKPSPSGADEKRRSQQHSPGKAPEVALAFGGAADVSYMDEDGQPVAKATYITRSSSNMAEDSTKRVRVQGSASELVRKDNQRSSSASTASSHMDRKNPEESFSDDHERGSPYDDDDYCLRREGSCRRLFERMYGEDPRWESPRGLRDRLSRDPNDSPDYDRRDEDGPPRSRAYSREDDYYDGARSSEYSYRSSLMSGGRGCPRQRLFAPDDMDMDYADYDDQGYPAYGPVREWQPSRYHDQGFPPGRSSPWGPEPGGPEPWGAGRPEPWGHEPWSPGGSSGPEPEPWGPGGPEPWGPGGPGGLEPWGPEPWGPGQRGPQPGYGDPRGAAPSYPYFAGGRPPSGPSRGAVPNRPDRYCPGALVDMGAPAGARAFSGRSVRPASAQRQVRAGGSPGQRTRTSTSSSSPAASATVCSPCDDGDPRAHVKGALQSIVVALGEMQKAMLAMKGRTDEADRVMRCVASRLDTHEDAVEQLGRQLSELEGDLRRERPRAAASCSTAALGVQASLDEVPRPCPRCCSLMELPGDPGPLPPLGSLRCVLGRMRSLPCFSLAPRRSKGRVNLQAVDAMRCLGRKLFDASRARRPRYIRMLLDKGADPDFHATEQWTPLQRACARGHAGIVRDMLRRGADVSARNAYGHTALHVAAYHDLSGRCVVLLVDAGANVHARSKAGRTPLHYAAWAGNVAAIRALFGLGARRTAKDNEGRTPLCFTKDAATRRLLRLLQRLTRERGLPRRWPDCVDADVPRASDCAGRRERERLCTGEPVDDDDDEDEDEDEDEWDCDEC